MISSYQQGYQHVDNYAIIVSKRAVDNLRTRKQARGAGAIVSASELKVRQDFLRDLAVRKN